MSSAYITEGALAQADAIKTAYAAAVLSLGTGTINITAGTTKTELEAQEATFTGYAPITIAGWVGPMLAEGSGALIFSGSQVFASAAPYSVTEVVTYWWLEQADGTVIMAGMFPSGIPMGATGQSLPFEIYLPFGANPV